MKRFFIILVVFITFYPSCMSSREATDSSEIIIEQAAYKEWVRSLPGDSDISEQGTDLEVVVTNWPEGAKPEYFIFRNWKSFPAEISDTSGIRITATVIKRSAVLSETSEKLLKTDRLVFTDKKGVFDFVEIKKWDRSNR